MCFLLLSGQLYLQKDLKTKVKFKIEQSRLQKIHWTRAWTKVHSSFFPIPGSVCTTRGLNYLWNMPRSLSSVFGTCIQPLLDDPCGPRCVHISSMLCPWKEDPRKRSAGPCKSTMSHLVREFQDLGYSEPGLEAQVLGRQVFLPLWYFR